MQNDRPDKFHPARPDPNQVHSDTVRMVERFSRVFDELREQLRQVEPDQLIARSGAELLPATGGPGSIALRLWSRRLFVSYPEFAAVEQVSDGKTVPAALLDTAFLLYYLSTADGAPLENRWIAFSDLPDGRFYHQAFQGYTGKELARSFGEDRSAFERAAAALDGQRLELGDAAFAFQALPRVSLAAVYWQGDEDFHSACQVLFDASASHYLPTDVCAVLGSALTRKLIKYRNQ